MHVYTTKGVTVHEQIEHDVQNALFIAMQLWNYMYLHVVATCTCSSLELHVYSIPISLVDCMYDTYLPEVTLFQVGNRPLSLLLLPQEITL